MRRILFGLLVAASAAGSGAAQETPRFGSSIAGGVHVQAYRFGEGIGAESAHLLLFPVAYRQQLGSRGLLELYTAYARGEVRMDGRTYVLSAPTDTWLRASWVALPGTTLTLGLNLPTGHPTHSSEEAVVATVLATDLLGFREASWGLGFGATAGLSSARRMGPWTVSGGASFRKSGEFSPRADTVLRYAPGDEGRLRMAMEREVGARNALSLGVTALTYTEDRLDGRNLFQSGPRLMADVSYTLRRGDAQWNLYVADIWRERGDVTLPIISQGSNVTSDTTFQTGTQNLLVLGISGSAPLRSGLVVRPGIDFRLQEGEDVGRQGWLLGAGGDVPLRAGGVELFPNVRVLLGSMETRGAEMKPFWGLETGAVLRWGSRP